MIKAIDVLYESLVCYTINAGERDIYLLNKLNEVIAKVNELVAAENARIEQAYWDRDCGR